MRRTISLLLTATALLGATALTACGSDDESNPAPAAAAAPTQTAAAPESSPPPKPKKHKAPAANAIQADIQGFAFVPQEIEVEVGQEITWTNADAAPHTVTATSGAKFDSGTMAQGATYTWKATKAGTIEYFCAIHPSMVGTIVVN